MGLSFVALALINLLDSLIKLDLRRRVLLGPLTYDTWGGLAKAGTYLFV